MSLRPSFSFQKLMQLSVVGMLLVALNVQAQSPNTMAADEKPPELQNVGIKEQLGSYLNLDEMVTDETGEARPLKSYFSPGKPVILSLVYFSCPGLCNLHLNGLYEGLQKVDWNPGEKFQVLALSFDSKEHGKPELAAKKRETYLKMLGRVGAEKGIHFATADQGTIERLTKQVGFSFQWSEETKEWAHASAAILLTPEGRIARYLHGVLFEPQTLKLAINEAGEGKVGTLVDQMVWYCFRYDPHQSKYTIYAFRLVQLGGGIVILLMGLFLAPFWWRSRKMGSRV